MRDDVLLRAADGFFVALEQSLAATPDDGGDVAGDCSNRLLAEVRGFERAALLACGEQAVVADASYLLCTLGDELMTERLGLGWTVVSLLVRHHGEIHGGQRSWVRLETLLQGVADDDGDPRFERALLRLYQRAIVLGLRGRHGLEPGGEDALARLREQVVARLRPGSGEQRDMGDLVALATRNVRVQRRWIAGALLALALLVLLLTTIAVRRGLDQRWDEAAVAMTRAATVARGHGGPVR